MKQKIKAAIVIIGNEILSGKIQDLNVHYLAQELAKLGIVLSEVRMIPDAAQAIVETIQHLSSKNQYVFTTGGIGPTHDDITAASIAKAFNLPLEQNKEAVRIMEERAVIINRPLHQNAYRMTYMPMGAELILNSHSGAPGFRIKNVYVMAGVPDIMRAMFTDLKPQLMHDSPIVNKTICVHSGENAIADMLESLNNEFPGLEMGSYPFQLPDHNWHTNLVISGRENDQNLIQAYIKLQNELKALQLSYELKE